MTSNGNDAQKGEDDWTQVRKKARRTRNPRTRKIVTELKTARELLTILAMLSIVPLDVYDTKVKGKFIIKLTHNNIEFFDSETTRRKLTQKKIKVVQDFNEEIDSLVVERRKSKIFRHYSEKELKDEIKKEKPRKDVV